MSLAPLVPRWRRLRGSGRTPSDTDLIATWARAARGAPLPLVLYGIPDRDLGSHSAGGFASSADYLAWIGAVAHHLGDAPAMIVVEPDALAQSLDMSAEERETRLRTLRIAVDILEEHCPEARIYLDASLWVSTWVMADLLHRANVGRADGFSLNVAGHADDGSVTEYGDTLSVMTGGKQYVVDTSRNGAAGANDEEWCNARGLGLGRRPGTLVAHHPRVDGLFWIKYAVSRMARATAVRPPALSGSRRPWSWRPTRPRDGDAARAALAPPRSDPQPFVPETHSLHSSRDMFCLRGHR